MSYCLATSLNFALKRFSMFELDETFSSNILPYEQMFDRLAGFCRLESTIVR